MDLSVEIALIGALQAVVVAVIGGLFALQNKRRMREEDKHRIRSEIRAEMQEKAAELTAHSLELGIASAKALRDGKTNGEIEAALESATAASKAYESHIRKVATKAANK